MCVNVHITFHGGSPEEQQLSQGQLDFRLENVRGGRKEKKWQMSRWPESSSVSLIPRNYLIIATFPIYAIVLQVVCVWGDIPSKVGQLEDNAVKRKERLAALKRKLAGEVKTDWAFPVSSLSRRYWGRLLNNLWALGNHHALVLGYAPKHFFTVTLIRGHPMVTIVLRSCPRLFSVAMNQMPRNCKVSIMI